jgi:hypothetical protein
MAELSLTTFAVSERWRLSEGDGRWKALLGEYLETLARRCTEAGPCVIGHIKALALFPDGGYLRASVVSPSIPASIEGSVPDGCTELRLDLNAIVYGLEYCLLERISLETAVQCAVQWNGEVLIERNRNQTHL